MPFVIDYQPGLTMGRDQIIGPFDTREDADNWGMRNIHIGMWHIMPLTPAENAATGLSASHPMESAIHA